MSVKEQLVKIAELFDYEAHDEDLDEQEYALAILMLLEMFYRKYITKTLTYYINHFNEDLKKLESDLIKKNESYSIKYYESKLKQELLKYKIPTSKHKQVPISIDFKSTKNIMIDTIKKGINYLKNDVGLKISVWKDRNEKDSEFQVDLKLRKFIKDIKKGIKYFTNTIYQKVNRNVSEFVYGKDAKFRWKCNGQNPCSWCRLQEKKDPQPLNMWPYDHLNGYCSIEPADEETSEAFNKLLGIG